MKNICDFTLTYCTHPLTKAVGLALSRRLPQDHLLSVFRDTSLSIDRASILCVVVRPSSP
jgi:hypothetical protein